MTRNEFRDYVIATRHYHLMECTTEPAGDGPVWEAAWRVAHAFPTYSRDMLAARAASGFEGAERVGYYPLHRTLWGHADLYQRVFDRAFAKSLALPLGDYIVANA